MSIDYRFEPLERWPLTDTENRSPILFKQDYDNTLKLLSKELGQLGVAGVVVIQVVTRNGAVDLRRDGALTSRAKVEHPGVRISFTSKHGPLTYATDQYEGRYAFQMPDWQANLRAIALCLEALRHVDRHGVSRRGEQYTGWLALESRQAGGMTRDQALKILAQFVPGWADLTIEEVFRKARKHTHPDRNNGSRDNWYAVENAGKTLGLVTKA